jgi:thioredoxin
MISNQFFIDNIWDYTKNKKFKYKGTKPVIIDFYATWCMPCKAIHPYLEELQKEYKGKVSFYQIDVDKEPEVTDLFKIENIPALVFIKDKKTYTIMVGKKTKEQLKDSIETLFFR